MRETKRSASKRSSVSRETFRHGRGVAQRRVTWGEHDAPLRAACCSGECLAAAPYESAQGRVSRALRMRGRHPRSHFARAGGCLARASLCEGRRQRPAGGYPRAAAGCDLAERRARVKSPFLWMPTRAERGRDAASVSVCRVRRRRADPVPYGETRKPRPDCFT